MLYVPESVAVQPAGGRCITNSWWVVHPHLGLAFYEFGCEEPAPQCNLSRSLVERMCRTNALHAGHVAKQIPVVFLAHALRERRLLRDAPRAERARSGR